MNVSLKPTKYDALVVLAVLLLAAAVGARAFSEAQNAARSGALMVVVAIDGQEVERKNLPDYAGQHTYESRGYTLTVDSADGWVDVTHADCPTKDCMHSGAISRAGQSIVCLPARITVTLVGSDAAYDVIAG